MNEQDAKDLIRSVFLQNGFTVKEGQADLEPYVFEAAIELLRQTGAFNEPIKSMADIERIAVKHEDFGFGKIDNYGISTHGFNPNGLTSFVNELLRSKCDVTATLIQQTNSVRKHTD